MVIRLLHEKDEAEVLQQLEVEIAEIHVEVANQEPALDPDSQSQGDK